jgi:hypothetical protein
MSIPHVDNKTLSVELLMTTLPIKTAQPLDTIVNLVRNMKEKGRGSVVVTKYVTNSAGHKIKNHRRIPSRIDTSILALSIDLCVSGDILICVRSMVMTSQEP